MTPPPPPASIHPLGSSQGAAGASTQAHRSSCASFSTALEAASLGKEGGGNSLPTPPLPSPPCSDTLQRRPGSPSTRQPLSNISSAGRPLLVFPWGRGHHRHPQVGAPHPPAGRGIQPRCPFAPGHQ